jgi:hypothetical protein
MMMSFIHIITGERGTFGQPQKHVANVSNGFRHLLKHYTLLSRYRNIITTRLLSAVAKNTAWTFTATTPAPALPTQGQDDAKTHDRMVGVLGQLFRTAGHTVRTQMMMCERVLFIGTQFSILYTSMYSPAEAVTPRA